MMCMSKRTHGMSTPDVNRCFIQISHLIPDIFQTVVAKII